MSLTGYIGLFTFIILIGLVSLRGFIDWLICDTYLVSKKTKEKLYKIL